MVDATSSSNGGGVNFYQLEWKHYRSCLTSGVVELLDDEEYSMTDVTLACEGQFVQCHKLVLAVSSPFFKQLFKLHRLEKTGTMVIVLANVTFKDLKNVIQFIYHGKVSLRNDDLPSFLKTVDLLEIKGLQQDANINSKQISSSFGPGPLNSDSAVNNAPIPSSSILIKSSTETSPSSSTLPVSNKVSLSVQPLYLQSVTDNYDPDFVGMDDEDDGVEDEDLIDINDVKPTTFSVYSAGGGEGEIEDDDNNSREQYRDLTYGNSFNNHQLSNNFLHGASSNSNQLVSPAPTSKKAKARRKRTVPPPPPQRPTHGAINPEEKRKQVGRCYSCKIGQRNVSRTKCSKCDQFVCTQISCRSLHKEYEGSKISYFCQKCAPAPPSQEEHYHQDHDQSINATS